MHRRKQENSALNGQACKIPLSFGDSQSERGIFTPGQLLLTPAKYHPRAPDSPTRYEVVCCVRVTSSSCPGGRSFRRAVFTASTQSQTFTETQTERPFLNT